MSTDVRLVWAVDGRVRSEAIVQMREILHQSKVEAEEEAMNKDEMKRRRERKREKKRGVSMGLEKMNSITD